MAVSVYEWIFAVFFNSYSPSEVAGEFALDFGKFEQTEEHGPIVVWSNHF